MVGLRVFQAKFLSHGIGRSGRMDSNLPADLPPILSDFENEGPVRIGPCFYS